MLKMQNVRKGRFIMKLFRYYGTICCEDIAGIVKANNISEAKEFLAKAYEDYDSWENKTIEEVEFSRNNVCEVFYGC